MAKKKEPLVTTSIISICVQNHQQGELKHKMFIKLNQEVNIDYIEPGKSTFNLRIEKNHFHETGSLCKSSFQIGGYIAY